MYGYRVELTKERYVYRIAYPLKQPRGTQCTRKYYLKTLVYVPFLSTSVRHGTGKDLPCKHIFPVFPENPGNFPKKNRREKIPGNSGNSGNVFRGFPGIPEIPGNFSGNLGVFVRTRAAEQGT